jgi:DNA-binding response OmpR family regulator
MTISLLLVDDDALVLEALTEYLQFMGYTVYPASNGTEALRLANHFPLDLVLSDLKMPGMDGYTLCRELYRLHRIPALLMSGFFENYERAHITVGVRDFIRKPFLPDELNDRIHTILAQAVTLP